MSTPRQNKRKQVFKSKTADISIEKNMVEMVLNQKREESEEFFPNRLCLLVYSEKSFFRDWDCFPANFGYSFPCRQNCSWFCTGSDPGLTVQSLSRCSWYMPVSELYEKFRFLLTVQPKNRGLDLTKLSCLTLLPDGSLLCSQPVFTALSFFYFYGSCIQWSGQRSKRPLMKAMRKTKR